MNPRLILIELMKKMNTLSFSVSNDLPYTPSGTPMYLKNLKRIYVDNPQKKIQAFIPSLNGVNVNSETSTIRVYFVCDAKQSPSELQDMIVNMINLKEQVSNLYFQSDCNVITQYEGDLLVTELEYTFAQLI